MRNLRWTAAALLILLGGAGRSDSFSFKSDAGDLEGKLGGYVAQNGRFFADSNPRSNTFFMKYARLLAEGSVFKDFEYRLMGEFAGSASLQDGWVAWRLSDHAKLTFGQFKVPFGQEALITELWTDYPEQSVFSRITPGRDQGVMGSGRCWDERIGWALALYNESGINTADNNDHQSAAARLTWKPLQDLTDDWGILRVGVAGTTGSQSGSPADVTSPASGTTILDYDASATISKSRDRLAYELAWTRGPGSVTAECGRDSFTLERTFTSGGIETHREGASIATWYVGGTCLLTGEDKKLDSRVKVRNPVTTGGYGAWEAAIRYGAWNPSQNLFMNLPTHAFANKATSTESLRELSIGVNFYPVDHVRFSVAWIQNDFDTPIDIGNRDRLGDENVILTRAQIDF